LSQARGNVCFAALLSKLSIGHQKNGHEAMFLVLGLRHLIRSLRFAVLGLLLVRSGMALAAPIVNPEIAPPAAPGTVEDTACRIVGRAAQSSHVPVALLTRLLWQESRFRAGARSPAGAQGIAQFMPGTAAEHGLTDPFDPEQAIPNAAKFLAELERRFGNFGLAAAAYNAGPNRVANWLAGSGSLPAETQAYVLALTGRAATDWAASLGQAAQADEAADQQSCAEVTAALRANQSAGQIPLAPWGVQLSGNFSKAIALASFARAEQRYRGIIGNLQPMIIGGVLRSRGRLPFYRVLVPEASRAQADQTCNAILADGGACVAVRT
jgi:hypothetical protein